MITMPDMPAAAKKDGTGAAALERPSNGGDIGSQLKKDCGSDGLIGPGSSFTATIDRREEDAIGLDIDLIDGVSAVVVDVKEGAIQTWNDKHPESALQVNDH